MTTRHDDPCKDLERLQRIRAAFVAGDLAALRGAVDDPALVPNGDIGDDFGSCLVYAIYHSPLAFVRELLEIGADPSAPVDDGFPPLIAALTTAREVPGATRRADMHELLRLLLAFGADPVQRGINDYTPLHMAVGEGDAMAVDILLEAGADPELRTRIDDCETPVELAESMGRTDLVRMLRERRTPLRRRLRPGLFVLAEVEGTGEPVLRLRSYRVRIRFRVKGGEPIRWEMPEGPVGIGRLEDGGETLVTEMYIQRSSMMNGLFYGVAGMRVGGMRRLEIAPHLAYGPAGVTGRVPADATLIAEITVLDGTEGAGRSRDTSASPVVPR